MNKFSKIDIAFLAISTGLTAALWVLYLGFPDTWQVLSQIKPFT